MFAPNRLVFKFAAGRFRRAYFRAWPCFVFIAAVAGCDRDSASPTQTLTVFAAASLTEPFNGIGQSFESQFPDCDIVFNFGGSQQLRGQLEFGANADVFASANPEEMRSAATAGIVAPASIQTIARNKLVVIYPADNPGRIVSLVDLGRKGLKIDIADPAVPVGRYSLKMLEGMSEDPRFGRDFKQRVLANVVSYEENVKAVASKVRLGEVDAGIVYVTDAQSDSGGPIGRLEVPDPFNPTAEYQIGVIGRSERLDAARRFVEFVMSPTGQSALAQHGFIPIRPTTP